MNNMDKWVDPRVKWVKAANIHAYLLARGWKLKSSPRPQVMLFEEPPGNGGKPILQTVPVSEGGSDYLDGIVRVITTLAALEDRYAVDVLNDILQQPPAEPASVNGPAPNPARVRESTQP